MIFVVPHVIKNYLGEFVVFRGFKSHIIVFEQHLMF